MDRPLLNAGLPPPPSRYNRSSDGSHQLRPADVLGDRTRRARGRDEPQARRRGRRPAAAASSPPPGGGRARHRLRGGSSAAAAAARDASRQLPGRPRRRPGKPKPPRPAGGGGGGAEGKRLPPPPTSARLGLPPPHPALPCPCPPAPTPRTEPPLALPAQRPGRFRLPAAAPGRAERHKRRLTALPRPEVPGGAARCGQGRLTGRGAAPRRGRGRRNREGPARRPGAGAGWPRAAVAPGVPAAPTLGTSSGRRGAASPSPRSFYFAA